MTSSYNLNDLVEIVVDAPPSYLTFFDNEYRRIAGASNAQDLPRVTLRVVDRLPDSMTREMRFKNLFRFRYAVRDLDSRSPEILFERHWLDRVYLTPLGAFIQGQILEPVVYAKLLESDVLFMHAAGVSREGRAFVFPAHGGTGKTTLALSLATHGFDLMGDDLLMVDVRNATVHPFARPLHLFTYNLKTLQVPFRLRAAIRTKNLLRWILNAISRQKFLIATRAHVGEILDVHFGTASQLAGIIFLRREGAREVVALDTVEERRKAAEAIIGSADLNDSLYVNIGEDPTTRARELDLVMRLLELVPKIEFINPRTMDEADRQQLARHLRTYSPAEAS